jgi:hypothetical protein
MGMEIDLIPRGTRVTMNGDGSSHDIRANTTRTFLCTLTITDQQEQESLDVSIWGSEGGENWGTQPLLRLPQVFYRGETRLVLDLTPLPEVKFIRAKWEVNRWGRVAPTPMFVIGLRLEEVPAFTRKSPAETASAAR